MGFYAMQVDFMCECKGEREEFSRRESWEKMFMLQVCHTPEFLMIQPVKIVVAFPPISQRHRTSSGGRNWHKSDLIFHH
jgi:hypothetical protein